MDKTDRYISWGASVAGVALLIGLFFGVAAAASPAQECAEEPRHDFVAVDDVKPVFEFTAEMGRRGFVGVHDVTVIVENLWCQPARSAAVNAYLTCQAKFYHFRGGYDGTCCCSVTGFDGEWTGANPADDTPGYLP